MVTIDASHVRFAPEWPKVSGNKALSKKSALIESAMSSRKPARTAQILLRVIGAFIGHAQRFGSGRPGRGARTNSKANPGLACSQLFGLRPIQIKGYEGAYKGRNNGASGRHPKCDQHAL